MALYPGPVLAACDPIVLNGVAVGQPTPAAGTTRGRNREAVGMLVDRIEILIGGAPSFYNEGLFLSMQLRYGDEPLTNGFVSLGGVCPFINGSFGTASDNANGVDVGYVSVIPLQRPFYMGPNEYVDVILRPDHSGLTSTIYVTLVGRQADVPKERWLPYLASYSTQFYTYNTAFLEKTTPQDLGNPFTTELEFHRLIASVAYPTTGDNVVSFLNSSLTGFPALRITDQNDDLWVPTFTPIGNVVNQNDLSWRVNTIMDPQGYLLAEIQGPLNFDKTVSTGRAALGMLASRKI